MQEQLNYLLANERIADLRRAAERERIAGSVKRQTFLARMAAHVGRRQRTLAGQAPARVSNALPAPAGTDAAAAEA